MPPWVAKGEIGTLLLASEMSVPIPRLRTVVVVVVVVATAAAAASAAAAATAVVVVVVVVVVMILVKLEHFTSQGTICGKLDRRYDGASGACKVRTSTSTKLGCESLLLCLRRDRFFTLCSTDHAL